MKTFTIIAMTLVLAACASYSGYGLRPGASTGDEVRRAMGPPAEEFSNPDGSRDLVYPHGPMGTQTFVVHLDARGVLKGLEQVLDDDHFFHIGPGLTRADVLRLIGPPGSTMEFPLQHQVAWEYRYIDTWGYQCEFSVTFDAKGAVVSKISRRLNQDRDRM